MRLIAVFACAVMLMPVTALAQAGSTGGTIGKTDKSISGGEEADDSRPSTRKQKPHRSVAIPPDEASGGIKGSSCGRIAGTWNWVLGITVVVKPNGSITSSNGLTATWSCNGGQYSFAWSNNINDRVSLSTDGKTLDVVNSIGSHFSSTRF